jgi:hypothetical protein
VFEFLDFIPRLTDPASCGGDPADAFYPFSGIGTDP